MSIAAKRTYNLLDLDNGKDKEVNYFSQQFHNHNSSDDIFEHVSVNRKIKFNRKTGDNIPVPRDLLFKRRIGGKVQVIREHLFRQRALFQKANNVIRRRCRDGEVS